MWILYVAVIIFLILLGISNLFLNFIFGKRCEGNPKLKYFTVEDFENLEAEKIEFKSNKEQILRGNIYTNKKIKKQEIKGLIVFVHGMGAGHLSYTTEINTLAKNGYKVLAYDNTGTCESEGKSLNGFYQAILDLKACLEFIKTDDELNELKLSLIGHSWGAYTVCQSLKFSPNVKSVISMCGPDSAEKLIAGYMGVLGKILNPFMKLINIIKFGKDSTESTIDILKKSPKSVSILLIHGKDDKTCKLENSIVYKSEETFKDNKNITCIIYEEKCHNVYQTKESEEYLNTVFDEIAKINKKFKGKELELKLSSIYENIDYKKITEEDEDVMNEIIDFLNKN